MDRSEISGRTPLTLASGMDEFAAIRKNSERRHIPKLIAEIRRD